MENQQNRRYRDRLRILLIIYFFSEPYNDSENIDRVALLKSEVRIQKLDFLLRYPSYLCYELILKMKEDVQVNRNKVRDIVKQIINSEEPRIRTIEMRKFLYGAWEYLDKTISFLKSHGLIDFKSELSSVLRQHKKEYFLTQFGKDKVENGLENIPTLNWYKERCLLIKEYFGDLGGSELKALQYQHEQYKEAMINEYIVDIEKQTRELFTTEFQEEI